MNIIITGISRGLGKSLTEYFLSRGDDVIGISRMNDAAIVKSSGDFKLITTDWIDIESLVRQITFLLKGKMVAIVINNAAMLERIDIDSVKECDLLNHYKVNAINPTLFSIALLESGLLSDDCHIVNIGSMAGFQGAAKFPELLAYSMSKASLASMTECLAPVLQPNQSVNCLCLGSVQTEMFESAFPDEKAGAEIETMTEFIYQYAKIGSRVMNGKIIPVNIFTP